MLPYFDPELIEHSPLDDQREHPVPCPFCRRMTRNWSSVCAECKGSPEDSAISHQECGGA